MGLMRVIGVIVLMFMMVMKHTPQRRLHVRMLHPHVYIRMQPMRRLLMIQPHMHMHATHAQSQSAAAEQEDEGTGEWHGRGFYTEGRLVPYWAGMNTTLGAIHYAVIDYLTVENVGQCAGGFCFC